jgi:hypothetical protein
MTDQIYVLGCGPAGLLAAHAVAIAGQEPIILSRKVKSEIGGAQYLHSAIPGVANEHDGYEVMLRKTGTRDGYAKKVYDDPTAPTSWEKYPEGPQRVWNMRAAYDRLWSEYESQIQETDLTPMMVEDMAKMHTIVSTVPKIALCPDPADYMWTSQPVWIRYGESVPDCICKSMEFVMSGNSDDEWYRQSSLFGWQGIEYPRRMVNSVKILKPLATTYPGVPGVIHLGRYGEWRKDVLVHDVYHRLTNLLNVDRKVRNGRG